MNYKNVSIVRNLCRDGQFCMFEADREVCPYSFKFFLAWVLVYNFFFIIDSSIRINCVFSEMNKL